MAGGLNPPFSLFLGEEKEKTGRSRSKREKDAPRGIFWPGGILIVPTSANEKTTQIWRASPSAVAAAGAVGGRFV